MESTTWVCTQSADDLLNRIHGRMVGAKHVESVVRSTPTTLDVSGAARPPWVPWVAILLFPIGLIAILVKEKRLLRFWAEDVGDGQTHLHVDGALVPGTRTALIELYN